MVKLGPMVGKASRSLRGHALHRGRLRIERGVAVQAASPQTDPASATRTASTKRKVIYWENARAELRLATFPNEPGAFDEAGHCRCRVPASGSKRRVVCCKRRVHLDFAEHEVLQRSVPEA